MLRKIEGIERFAKRRAEMEEEEDPWESERTGARVQMRM